MHILLVTHYFPGHRGGVELVAQQLARRIVRRNQDVSITWMASADGDPGADDGVLRVGARAWNVTEARFGFPYPLWTPSALLRLDRLVREADVVHLHDSLYLGNVAAFLGARRHGTPVLVTQHVGLVPYPNRLVRGMLGLANRTIATMVLGGCDQAVFVSPHVRDYFAQWARFRRPPLRIPNGVDRAVFSPPAAADRAALRASLGFSDRPVRLFVGRFVEKKGLPFLRELARRRPDDLWVFIGWGPDDPARWGLPNVRSIGGLPQAAIVDYYRAADALVLPSVGEGFPLVVQEAMACGLPALITTETLAGAPEAAGALDAVELDAGAWERALDRVDLNPQAERRRGAIVEATARWDWDDVADRYAALLGEMASRRTGTRQSLLANRP